MATVAALRGVSKRYGTITALHEVDLNIDAGRVTALLGRNGAGKTTAVRLMLGLARPSSGTASLFDRDPHLLAARERVGVMLQVSKVPETLTVAEHLRLFSSYYPRPLPAGDVIEIAGLAGLERRAYGRLSGGQQRRLMFALAICGDPDLLMLDEPTVGLDVESRRLFWAQMRQFVARGRALLLTTHYLEEADALADRIVIIHRGRITADATPAAIKDRARSTRVACTTRLAADDVRAIPGVVAVHRDGDRTLVEVTNIEDVLRTLLNRDPLLSGLEISRATLEDAYVDLTGAPQ